MLSRSIVVVLLLTCGVVVSIVYYRELQKSTTSKLEVHENEFERGLHDIERAETIKSVGTVLSSCPSLGSDPLPPGAVGINASWLCDGALWVTSVQGPDQQLPRQSTLPASAFPCLASCLRDECCSTFFVSVPCAPSSERRPRLLLLGARPIWSPQLSQPGNNTQLILDIVAGPSVQLRLINEQTGTWRGSVVDIRIADRYFVVYPIDGALRSQLWRVERQRPWQLLEEIEADVDDGAGHVSFTTRMFRTSYHQEFLMVFLFAPIVRSRICPRSLTHNITFSLLPRITGLTARVVLHFSSLWLRIQCVDTLNKSTWTSSEEHAVVACQNGVYSSVTLRKGTWYGTFTNTGWYTPSSCEVTLPTQHLTAQVRGTLSDGDTSKPLLIISFVSTTSNVAFCRRVVSLLRYASMASGMYLFTCDACVCHGLRSSRAKCVVTHEPCQAVAQWVSHARNLQAALLAFLGYESPVTFSFLSDTQSDVGAALRVVSRSTGDDTTGVYLISNTTIEDVSETITKHFLSDIRTNVIRDKKWWREIIGHQNLGRWFADRSCIVVNRACFDEAVSCVIATSTTKPDSVFSARQKMLTGLQHLVSIEMTLETSPCYGAVSLLAVILTSAVGC